tara:strand:- start:980 stop:1381 length:402 start_codon:yes stop_codon:yes gene_type:complete
VSVVIVVTLRKAVKRTVIVLAAPVKSKNAGVKKVFVPTLVDLVPMTRIVTRLNSVKMEHVSPNAVEVTLIVPTARSVTRYSVHAIKTRPVVLMIPPVPMEKYVVTLATDKVHAVTSPNVSSTKIVKQAARTHV